MLQFLSDLPPQYQGSKENLLALLKSMADGTRSPLHLSKDKCHQIDSNHDIWEFIAGKIRVLWFYDKEKIILCSNAFLKQTNKTPKSEISLAIACKIKYEADKKSNRITILQDEQGTR
ncbi:MAG: type II toxin-antitoxin system RelE/ParE family toxin [Magnetococcus sp. YQC-9]